MNPAATMVLGSLALLMLLLSLWWTFRAFDRGRINIGKLGPIWLTRRDSPGWFWFWMAIYFLNIAIWLAFTVLFLIAHPYLT